MATHQARRQAKAERAAAWEDLNRVAAAALPAGLLTPELVIDMRRVQKRGRDSRASVNALSRARAGSYALADRLRNLLRRDLRDVPERVEHVAESPKGGCAHRRSSVSVIPIERLPFAGSSQSSLFDAPATVESTPGPVTTPPRTIIELTTDEPVREAEFSMRKSVVRAMIEDGKSGREALDAVGATHLHARTAQRWAVAAKSERPVHDRRWTREGKSHVLTVAVQVLILMYWNGRASAPATELATLVAEKVTERNRLIDATAGETEIAAPSAATIKRFLQRLPEPVKRMRGMAMADFNKRDRMLGRTTPTTFANELWEMDSQQLKIRIRVRSGGEWKESKVWLLVILDVFSRAVMGWVLTITPPDAWTACSALYMAIMPKPDERLPMRGPPDAAKPDRGGEFINDDVKRMLNTAGIKLTPAPPNYPNAKGNVESYFSGLQQRLTRLPGYQDDEAGATDREATFLAGKQTFAQLADWIKEDVIKYHDTKHSELAATPKAVWLASAKIGVIDEDAVTLLLLHATETRVVQHCAIDFTVNGQGGRYQHEALLSWNGKAVLVRSHPHVWESVLIYSAETGAHICEALHESLITVEHLREVNRTARKSLLAVTRDLQRQVWDADVQRQLDYDEAHAPDGVAVPEDPAKASRTRKFARTGRPSTKPEKPVTDPAFAKLDEMFSPTALYGP